MRLLSLLLFLVFSGCQGQSLDFLQRSAANYDYSVFIGGQSNPNGQATNPDARLTGALTNVKIHNPAFGQGYETLQFGVNNQANNASSFGPELSLGKYLGDAVGHTIYMAKYAVNGYGLANMPGSMDFWPGDSPYSTLVGRIINANTALPALTRPLKRIFVWQQGERDGQGETGLPTVYSSVYSSNFFTWIAQLQTDIGFNFDMIIICRLSENQRLGYLTTVTGFDQVKTQQDVIVATGGAQYRMVTTDNSYTFPTDAAHYNTHGADLNGVNIAKTILGETITVNPAVKKLHLDGKLGVTLTSGKVSAWADQSGNGRNATQSNASLRPTYNGTDAITFNADAILILTAFINDFKNDIQGEFIVVFERTNTLTPVDWIWGVSSSSSDNSYSTAFVRATASSHPDRIWPYKQNGVGAGSQLYVVDVIPASPFIFSVANNTYGTKAFQNSAHEVELDPSFGNVGEPNWLSNTVIPYDTFTIGGLSRLSGNLLSKFKIKAFIYYDRMLSYSERQVLFSDLTTYYGL